MVDALLVSLSSVCKELLPILGAVVLIFLCIAIKKLWKVIETLDTVLGKAEPTIDLVDKSIEKLQGPLDTVNKYSSTLDDLHDKAVDSASKVAEFANENATKVKSTMTDTFQKVSSAFMKSDNKDAETVVEKTTVETPSEKKDPFERDQRIYDEVAKYTAKEKEENV